MIPPKIYTKSSYPQSPPPPKKILISLQTKNNIEIENFEPQKMTRAYVCMKISEYRPPPPPGGGQSPHFQCSIPYLKHIGLLISDVIFMEFYLVWTWWPSWSCDHKHLWKISFSPPKENLYEIWLQLAKWFLWKRCLDMHVAVKIEQP